MKKHNIIRVLALILTLVMTLSMFVACDNSGDNPAESSKPAETTKTPETTEHTHDYGEYKVIKEPNCTEFGEKTASCACGKTITSSIAPSGHTYENPQVLQAATCTEKGRQKATCACGATEETDIDALGHDYVSSKCTRCEKAQPHTHTFTNNVCTVCNSKAFTNAANNYGLTGMVEKESAFDGNKDGTNDTFYFAPTLADKFTAADAIHMNSSEFDKELSNNPSPSTKNGITHYYVDETTDEYIVYKVNVTEGGVYDMAIHLRLKDDKERGNKFTVNAGTESEYSFETSFKPADDTEINAMKSTDGKDSSYMYGMQIDLVEGENIIKIEKTTCEKCQHYRDFYFVKVA